MDFISTPKPDQQTITDFALTATVLGLAVLLPPVSNLVQTLEELTFTEVRIIH